MIPRLLQEISGVFDHLPELLLRMRDFQGEIAKFFDAWHLPFNSQAILGELGQRSWLLLRNWLLQLGEGMVKLLSQSLIYVLTPLVAYYFSRDYPNLKRNAYQWLEVNFGAYWTKTFEEIDNVFRIYIRGQLLDTAIVGFLIGIGLTILGFDSAFLLGMMAGIFNLIPYFGPILGALPAVVLSLLQSPWQALYVGLLFLLVNQIEVMFLAPRIIGGNLGIHPITVVYLILLGGTTFGLLGMICAIPIGAIGIIIIKNFYNLCFTSR